MNNNVKHVIPISICVNIECLQVSELESYRTFHSRIRIVLESEET